MQNRNSLHLSLFVATISFLASCAGSSPSGGEATTTESIISSVENEEEENTGLAAAVRTGFFVDSPVGGLDFVSGGHQGVTDAAGAFQYEEGETVSFSIGGVSLGTTTPAETLTPVDMVPSGTSTSDAVVNIARFLQTLDDDGDPNNGISISNEVKQALAEASVQVSFDVPPAQFESTNQNAVARVQAIPLTGGVPRPLVSASAATAHLQSSITRINLGSHTSRYLATEDELPECNDTRHGWLYFVGEGSEFRYCSTENTYKSITFTASGIDWKGAYESAPENPTRNWAYYNSTEGKSYLWDGSEWQILAKDGGSGSTAADGADGADGKSSLVVVADEVAGDNCANGGTKISSGLDENGNGTLDANEVESSSYICSNSPFISTCDVNGEAPEKIIIYPDNLTLTRAASQNFVAIGSYSNGCALDLTEFVWWESNSDDLSNSDEGDPDFYANSAGSATITAQYGGIHASTGVTIIDKKLTHLAITPKTLPERWVGFTYQLTATGTYSDNSTADLTESVSWYLQGVETGAAQAEISNNGLVTLSQSGGALLITGAYQNQGGTHRTEGAQDFSITERFNIISSGENHTCATLSDQSVQCWGANNRDQIGSENGEGSNLPVVKSGINNVTQVSAGYSHTCSLNTDGKVRCWGSNQYSQISTENNLNSNVDNATQISAGGNHTCALLASGEIKCWGRGNEGQLGDGVSRSVASGNANASIPVDVDISTIGTVSQISAGYSHTCALHVNGKIWCWGSGESGELGNKPDGSLQNTGDVSWMSSIQVLNINTATQISAGLYHTCAVLFDGGVKCWGRGESGQLGNGSTPSTQVTPVKVSGITTAVQVSAGGAHTCAVLEDKSVWCWGRNASGQLGNNLSTSNQATPVQVIGTGLVKQVSAGRDHTCAVREDNVSLCWGKNASGQLGDNSQTDAMIPFPVGVKAD